MKRSYESDTLVTEKDKRTWKHSRGWKKCQSIMRMMLWTLLPIKDVLDYIGKKLLDFYSNYRMISTHGPYMPCYLFKIEDIYNTLEKRGTNLKQRLLQEPGSRGKLYLSVAPYRYDDKYDSTEMVEVHTQAVVDHMIEKTESGAVLSFWLDDEERRRTTERRPMGLHYVSLRV